MEVLRRKMLRAEQKQLIKRAGKKRLGLKGAALFICEVVHAAPGWKSRGSWRER